MRTIHAQDPPDITTVERRIDTMKGEKKETSVQDLDQDDPRVKSRIRA